MNEKTKIQLICIQLLGLLGLLFGKMPSLKAGIDFLSDLVLTRWDEIWAIRYPNKKSSDSLAVEQALLAAGMDWANRHYNVESVFAEGGKTDYVGSDQP